MNETIATIHDLRSIHGNFSEREVSNEDLQTILEASVRAANASARQSYSIIVIEDADMMKKLCGYAGSKLLLYCVDYNRLFATAAHLGYDFDADGVVSFVTGSTDTILAAQTAAVAARSLGIDSLFTNGIHRGDINRVYELLNLPRTHCFPLIALILGYPTQEPEYLKGRLYGPGVIHYGSYKPLSSDEIEEMLAYYDNPDGHMALNHAWMEKGFAHYHDWFFKVWSARGEASATKSQMFTLLESAGFLETTLPDVA
ncbi:MAG: nitroreductase family protein [Anaerolineae bacterium]|nr:nitroreductase family protein [Anaerolineae bacterium]